MFDTRPNPARTEISSVHQELKLSAQLESNLQGISSELKQLREELEQVRSDKEMIQKQLKKQKEISSELKKNLAIEGQNTKIVENKISNYQQLVEKYEAESQEQRNFVLNAEQKG